MDIQTFSIAVGLIASLIFTEVFGLAAGGMIVPGYFALSLHKPACIALTLAAALATFAIVRLLSQATLIYGRRRITMMLVCGFVVGAALKSLTAWLQGPLPAADASAATMTVIGFIIPGLIALWIDRQGLVETVAPLVTLSVAVRLVLVVLGLEVLQ
jgi:poly-gamma-glutamate biosynthesis protein PgsC/CapC